MVERAFVLINTDYQIDDLDLVKELKSIKGVSEAYRLCGIYDILVKVEAPTIDKVREVVGQKLKSMGNVKSTITMVAVQNGW